MKFKLAIWITILSVHALKGQNRNIYAYDDSLFVKKDGLFWRLKDSLPDANYFLFDNPKVKGIKPLLIESGRYKNGRREGLFLLYSNIEYNNYIRYIIPFHLGKMNGIYHEYYSGGRLSYIGEYVENKKNGEWTSFTEKGVIDMVQVFRYDTLIFSKQFYPDGRPKLFVTSPFSQSVDTIKAWGKNGTIQYEGYYESGKLLWWKKYNSEGQLLKEANGEFNSLKNRLIDFTDSKYFCYSCLINTDEPYTGTIINYSGNKEIGRIIYSNGIKYKTP